MKRFLNPARLLAALALLYFLPVQASEAQVCPSGTVLFVDADATGANNGTSWADAFTDLQSALNSSCMGIQAIWVADGVYYPDEGAGQVDGDRDSSFMMRTGLAIYGGFDGTETNQSQRQPDVNVTILSGDLNQDDSQQPIVTDASTNTNTGDNARHVVQCLLTASCLDDSAILDGFTVTAGNAGTQMGGGALVDDAYPSFANTTFSGNKADMGGGVGVVNTGTQFALSDVTFRGNTAESGAGLWAQINPPAMPVDTRLERLTFENNTISQVNLPQGGGLYLDQIAGNVFLIDSEFDGNTATNPGSGPAQRIVRGGGAYIRSAENVTVQGSTFSSNVATARSSSGGGLYLDVRSGLTHVQTSRFESNNAAGGAVVSIGGGLYLIGDAALIEDSDFVGNQAKSRGGGADIEAPSGAALDRVSAVGNFLRSSSATYGAGLHVEGNTTATSLLLNGNYGSDTGAGLTIWNSELDFSNGTIVANEADRAAGLFVTRDSRLDNSIVWGNTSASTGQDIEAIIGTLTVSYSIVENSKPGGTWDTDYGTDGGNNLDTDPLFKDADGADDTPGNEDDDFTLSFTSPAIDSGDNTVAALSGLLLDVAGNNRFIDEPNSPDTGNGSAPNIDRGALETLPFVVGPNDYGDAPTAAQSGFAASYPTRSADSGAAHDASSPTLWLGASVDEDIDGLASADAGKDGTSGDDGIATDDEDGIIAASPLVAATDPTVGSLEITTYGAGYLSAWIDFNQNGAWTDEAAATGEEIFSDFAIGSVGTTVISVEPFAIPAGASPGNTYLRVRFCAAIDSCDSPTGATATGEVEDHQVTFIDGTANFTPIISMDDLPFDEVIVDGPNTCFTQGGTDLFCAPTSTLADPIINGTSGNDTFKVNFSAGSPFPNGVTFNGLDQTGTPGDSIWLLGGSATTVEHRFYNTSNGSILIDATVIAYTGLEPILDNLSATDRVFAFLSANVSEAIILGDDGTANDGVSFIDSDDGESVAFTNPTGSLTINAGDGDHTIDVGLLDTSGGLLPAIDVVVNGGADPDAFNVAPDPTGSGDYTSYTIHGGDPSVCPGDVLQLTGGTPDGGATRPNGTITFTSAHQPIAYTGMEVLGYLVADVSIAASFDDTEAYPGDDIVLTIAVANAGGVDEAQCITVDLSAYSSVLNGTSPPLPAPVVSGGTVDFGTLTWTIGTLAPGASETIEITFVVDTQVGGDYTSTISATPQNTEADASDNSVTLDLTVLDPFVFPRKGQVNAAVFTTLASGLERMVVGLHGGSPGIGGAVWCRIPEPDGVVFTVAGQPTAYKTCSEGLPQTGGSYLPLIVNDFWLDESGPTAGRIYLTTWGGSGLYYSDDHGESWISAEPDLGDGFEGQANWVNVYGIAPDATEGILYITANNGLVFRSLNNGGTWQKVSSLPEGPSNTAWTLLGHPSTSGTLFAGTMGKGVYVSTDYGFSWSVLAGNVTTGPSTLAAENAAHIFDLEMVESAAADYLFAGTSRGVWRMDYAGAQIWKELDPDQMALTPTGQSPEVRDISFGDIDGSGTDELYAVTWGFGILRHEDPFAAVLTAGDLDPFALRGAELTFFAISPSGAMVAGTGDGALVEVNGEPTDHGSAVDAEEAVPLPDGFVLGPNYPNPFNPTTMIPFALPESGHVRISITDLLGREVSVLVDGALPAGTHEAVLDATGLTSGVYLYRMVSGGVSVSRTLTLMR